jgi:mannose/cellobiose epimerase-like protein (N-acyl-D-glucosamine 2-epimerase family)
MNAIAEKNILKAQNWLTQSVFPIWFEKGFETSTGCFVEAFSMEGEPLLQLDRRAMVQARQIFAVTEAVRLNLFDREKAKVLIQKNIQLLIERYSLSTGGYAHSINAQLVVSNADADLYTQAFVLFGLAKAYEILQQEQIVIEAKKLLSYLKQKRSLNQGGYSEIKKGETLYQSNPHMHLYEAALGWLAVSQDSCWRELVDELTALCTSKFIQAESGMLAEHYSSPWSPLLIEGHFIFEPGHHYEWAWLLSQYQQLTGVDTSKYSHSLFKSAESFGLSTDRHFVIDEVLSNTKAYKKSSRFWPQTERIKAAVELGYGDAADQAFETLFRYFEGLPPGLWQDTLLDNGQFQNQPVKASSLYHIINALSEYILKRQR